MGEMAPVVLAEIVHNKGTHSPRPSEPSINRNVGQQWSQKNNMGRIYLFKIILHRLRVCVCVCVCARARLFIGQFCIPRCFLYIFRAKLCESEYHRIKEFIPWFYWL